MCRVSQPGRRPGCILTCRPCWGGSHLPPVQAAGGLYLLETSQSSPEVTTVSHHVAFCRAWLHTMKLTRGVSGSSLLTQSFILLNIQVTGVTAHHLAVVCGQKRATGPTCTGGEGTTQTPGGRSHRGHLGSAHHSGVTGKPKMCRERAPGIRMGDNKKRNQNTQE